MIEAASWIMEVLVSEKVDVDAVLGFVYLGNLGRDKKRACEDAGRGKADCETAVLKKIKTENIFCGQGNTAFCKNTQYC